MDATVVVVEGGAQSSHVEQGVVARASISGVLTFFCRIFARIANYITRTRHCFAFTVFRGGDVEVKEGKRVISKTEVKVKEGVLVESCGAVEPELVEIIVSEQKAVTHSFPDVDSKLEVLNPDGCGSECLEQTMHGQLQVSNAHLPILCAQDHVVRTIEDMLATVKITTDPHQQELTAVPLDFEVVEIHLEGHGNKIDDHIKVSQELEICEAHKPAIGFNTHERCAIEQKSVSDRLTSDPPQHELTSATCEPVTALPLDLDTVDQLEGDAHRNDLTQEQHAFQEDTVQNEIGDKCIIFQSPPPNNDTIGSSTDSPKNGFLGSTRLSASSTNPNTSISVDQLHTTVGEQLIKHLSDLEKSGITGKPEPHATWNSRTTHKRAIVLATLVAVAVWARNAKQLHESMPTIRGSTINVHIRSRL